MSKLLDGTIALDWSGRTFEAGRIWSQVKDILDQNGLILPATPRRPDIRMILRNTSGVDLVFRNPGNHSDKAEHIPASGEETAAMVMVFGETLTEQFAIAARLAAQYQLAEKGLTTEFTQALASSDSDANELVNEAYGPASFDAQAKKIVPLKWRGADGIVNDVEPFRSDVCVYGARAPAEETAFLVKMPFSVQGSDTVPENAEGGIVIAVSEDWQTHEVSTRPIVPSVAKDFYGAHYNKMPLVLIDPEGTVQSINLRNGNAVDLIRHYQMRAQGPA